MKNTLFIVSFFLSGFFYAQNFFHPEKQKVEISYFSENNIPEQFTVYTVEKQSLINYIDKTASYLTKNKSDLILSIPTPQGIKLFKVYQSLTTQRLSKNTKIKTYRLAGIGNYIATGSLVINPFGIYIAVYPSLEDSFFIQSINPKNNVMLFKKKHLPTSEFTCFTDKKLQIQKIIEKKNRINDETLRVYRFAVGATGEYSEFHIQRAINSGIINNNATDDQKKDVVLSAIATTIDRVNAIYERDFSISLELVPNEKDVIFLDPNTDPYDNDDIISMYSNNTNVLNTYIGSSNYDGGHLFTTYPGGGVSGLGIICSYYKAASITGSSNPIGDAYDVDYVAHEIGHAFGANHTFANSCNNNRNLNTSVEPGSGSTIMAYAGVCSPNIQQHSDDYFHIVSINEVENFITNYATCSNNLNINNNSPQITTVSYNNAYIPKNTPFMLEATATDANNDHLTYCWEQIDPVTNSNVYTWYPNSNRDNGPLFRTYPPDTLGIRYFPAMDYIISGNYANNWEVLPEVNRTLNFSVTVRDNHLGGGQTPYQIVSLQVDANTGPFRITNLDTDASWTINSTQNITWDVAGTNGGMVNCTEVDILFSIDDGKTFPFVLAQNLPNNGSASFTIPQNIPETQTGRIMLKAHNNYFFDVAKAYFKIINVSNNENTDLLIYPIPAENSLKIVYYPDFQNQPILIRIFDIRGRLIIDKTYQPVEYFENTIQISNLSSGIYFFEIENGNEVKRKKILIK